MPEEGHRHYADMLLQPTKVEHITEGRGLKQTRNSCYFVSCSPTWFRVLREKYDKSPTQNFRAQPGLHPNFYLISKKSGL